MNFFSVDVETANWDKGSICQIGWSIVNDGEITQSNSTLINPQTYFDPFNVDIHGITAKDVEDAPLFGEVKEEFRRVMNSLPVISYGMFDFAAFNLADDNHQDTPFVTESSWINGQRIIRRAWPEYFGKKYRLSLVAEKLGLELQAHDAGSDARVLAQAILMAAAKMGISFEELTVRAYQRMTPRDQSKYRESIIKQGIDGGPLTGETICFTGSLAMYRAEAAEMVNSLGASVVNSVTRKTTILVLGTQDSPMIVDDKSRKHRKAEELNSEGYSVEIMSEDQFFEILRQNGAGPQ